VECQETISLLTKDKRLNLLKGDHEIMPGVKCLFCPGHTPGLQAVAATTKDGTTVLGSDCAHLFENYEGKWPSDLTVNVVALMESFNKIMTHASRPDLVFPGHDPLMTTKYKSVAKNVSQIA
jgi:glyoxylase-like metal-dependent hydrolase (beta-lactamase superfamily II)